MTEQIMGYRTTFAALFKGNLAPSPDGAEAPGIREVEIPLIQRDYAQGRVTDKVNDIRTGFLDALHHAILDESGLSLDFVYGDVTNGVLRPLDGQQRLTTLFLLHWFVAVYTGRDPQDEEWVNFSYVTRPSARRFCELLSQHVPPGGEESLSAWIVDQPWYLYGWEHDPTIGSMLVMLDAIHARFADADLERVWERLNDGDDPPVSFYVLPIEEMGAGDELYIKMNSRGKPLTDFENFKAKFEAIIAHSPRASAIAHKIDGAWSDVMWPFHGGDNIVDDEFMHYFQFVVDICEWRQGRASEGRLIDRVQRLFGAGVPDADASLEFFEACMDTWVGEDIAAYFGGLFRAASDTTQDERPVLFAAPEWLSGINLFDMCCRVYGDMRDARSRSFPLGLTILFYAILRHRIIGTDSFPVRLRILRNLVESSENEIRADRMPLLLEQVDALVEHGKLPAANTFNTAQIEDELRKERFLAEHPEQRETIHRLEDHRLLRGMVAVLALDAERLASRAVAFGRVFDDRESWIKLTGALLTRGDYCRRLGERGFQFGSPTVDSWWRRLMTGPAPTPISAVAGPLEQLLDHVDGRDEPLPDIYDELMADWLAEREARDHFDWRYYLVKYPIMRVGTSGVFVSETTEMSYELCALRHRVLNSNYRDPFLSAMHQASGLDPNEEPEPWFYGYQYHPRWLRLKQSGIAVRNRESALLVDIPDDVLDEALRKRLLDLGFVPAQDHWRWSVPQTESDGENVDLDDRVVMGGRVIRLLAGSWEQPARSG